MAENAASADAAWLDTTVCLLSAARMHGTAAMYGADARGNGESLEPMATCTMYDNAQCAVSHPFLLSQDIAILTLVAAIVVYKLIQMVSANKPAAPVKRPVITCSPPC